MTDFEISNSTLAQIVGVDIKLTEKLFSSLNKNEPKCKNYDNGETFNGCIKKFYRVFLDESTNCTLPGNFFYLFLGIS